MEVQRVSIIIPPSTWVWVLVTAELKNAHVLGGGTRTLLLFDHFSFVLSFPYFP